MIGSRAEGAELPATAERVRVLPGLGDLPVVVVVAGERRGVFKRIAAQWQEAQDRLAALSTCAETVVADGAKHFVQLDRPDVVANAVRIVEPRVRSG